MGTPVDSVLKQEVSLAGVRYPVSRRALYDTAAESYRAGLVADRRFRSRANRAELELVFEFCPALATTSLLATFRNLLHLHTLILIVLQLPHSFGQRWVC